MRLKVNHGFVVFSDCERAESELRSLELAAKDRDDSPDFINRKVEVSAVDDGFLRPPEV